MLDWFANLGFTQSLLLIIGVGLVISVIVWLFLTAKERKAGGAKSRAAGILRRYAARHEGKVLSDITLEGKNGWAHMDHILVGYFGVLFVTVLGEVGSYYGDEGDESWTIVPEGKAKQYLPNPLKNGETAMDALRGVLSKNDVYNVPMEQLVVLLPSFNEKREFCIRKTLPVINVRKLSSRLSTSHFVADNGVDVEKVVSLIHMAAGE